ncbi:MAG: hypothetical protein JWR83_1639 [Aeromicrobium sp.]|nr:hypothetical protein [Aeromicrobium sp.]
MTNIDFARRWAETRTSDLAAHRELYAASEDFVVENRMVDDHLGDTISTDAEFADGLSDYANADPSNGIGVQTITVTEAFEGGDHLFVHWDWSVEGARSYHGVPTDGKTLTSTGSSFLRFDDAGQIVLESTFLNENPIFQQLGLPIITPHYWEPGFDPSTLS